MEKYENEQSNNNKQDESLKRSLDINDSSLNSQEQSNQLCVSISDQIFITNIKEETQKTPKSSN